MVYQSQGISIGHFDTKSGLALDIKATLNNTVAEYLFGNITYFIGTVYEQTTIDELKQLEGKTLQFANGSKFYFADSSVREQLFPTPSDGAAYGSLPFTPCLKFTEAENVRILVINDKTGENNAHLNPDLAKKLVGDCWCRIDYTLHQLVGGEKNTPFQFRLYQFSMKLHLIMPR
ncbi:hypothetical protein PCC7424_5646 (plasmid) [Gloeothece citriformis PCC 7424]|uniref:Uncharacterized protein n=1 Tax=Gloeothece citriformis (strain PCC 7424) TaxID=65393 RepID=B7KLQ0_GLOC7|nr:hypothetical protein [Gloeothece citriformis]ACK73722.1 hypothetical protein PCC7424_5646 [Gloeothece citriformis PCC 7424]